MDAVAAEVGEVRWPALPAEALLDMPAQSLRQRRAARSGRVRLPSAPRGMALRRLIVIGGAVLMTAAAADEMYKVLTAGSLTALVAVVLVLFVVLFAWIALAFTSAVSGFICLLFGGEHRLGISPDAPLPALTVRTALLMPTYNECNGSGRGWPGGDPRSTSLRPAAAILSIMFILSDTTDPDIWIAEEAAFLALRDRTGGA